MFYQDHIDRNLLQLFAHRETSERFSITSGTVFLRSASLLKKN